MRAALLFAGACDLAACDVAVTVGYNEAPGLVSPQSCPSDALLGECSRQGCVVVELSAAQMGRETIAVDTEYIYFVRPDNVIARMPTLGGPIEDLAIAAPGLERLTLDDEFVYWTEHNATILRVPKTGGDAAIVKTISGNPVSIAAHEDELYIALTEQGAVAMVSKSTGAETQLAGQDRPVDLGVDAEHVVWINQGLPGGATGELVRAPLGNLEDAEVIRSGLEEPLSLGVTADAIVWATWDRAFRLPRGGGEPQLFEADFGEPKGVTEFDGILYVAGAAGFFRIRLADGDVLALDRRGITGLATACDGIYLVGWYEPLLLRYGR
jgi:hypothetical protein